VVYVEVQADDLSRAAAFYREIFGWVIEPAQQDLPVEYWRMHSADGPEVPDRHRFAGGLLKRPAEPPAPGQGTNAFVCSFEVDDFDATADRIAAQGGQVALPKFAVPGRCWQGYFLDTEGNTFGIFEVDERAG
jgi:uncharacterized protein